MGTHNNKNCYLFCATKYLMHTSTGMFGKLNRMETAGANTAVGVLHAVTDVMYPKRPCNPTDRIRLNKELTSVFISDHENTFYNVCMQNVLRMATPLKM